MAVSAPAALTPGKPPSAH